MLQEEYKVKTFNKNKFVIIAFIVIVIITLVLLLVLQISKKSISKTSNQIFPSVLPTSQTPPSATLPVEGQIGTVVDIVIKPDGKVGLVTDKKTYLLPADQKVTLYTSETESTSISIDNLQKETIVNVIKYTNPEKYVIVGTVDKALVGKLI